MFFRKALMLTLALAFVLITAASASYAYSSGQGSGTSVSVFAADDERNSQSGFGVSLTTKGAGASLNDFTYLNLGSYQMGQLSTLTQTRLFGYPVNYGLALGYSSPKSGESGVFRGVTSGLLLVLGKAATSSGLSIDLRLCTMSYNVNPVRWLTNPDILWGGVGLSYGF